MKVVDSAGWLEHFTGGPLGPVYREYLMGADVIVPTIIIYEVCKFIRRWVSAERSREALVAMEKRAIVDLYGDLAAQAAIVSLRHKLPMADAIIYATATAYGADLITSDAHLKDLPGVTFIPKL
jgi:toxin FitB